MVASPLASHKYMPEAPTAATAPLPTRPIHIMSVRLYAIWMSWVAMMGKASFASEGRMRP